MSDANTQGKNPDDLTIKINCDHETTIDGNISHTMPFLLGFFMALVIPVVFIVMASELAKETFELQIPWNMKLLHYNPTTIIWLFVVSVCGIVLLYWIHCRYCVNMARVERERRKNLLEVRSGLVHKALDILRPRDANKKNNVEKIAVVFNQGVNGKTQQGGNGNFSSCDEKTININITLSEGLSNEYF